MQTNLCAEVEKQEMRLYCFKPKLRNASGHLFQPKMNEQGDYTSLGLMPFDQLPLTNRQLSQSIADQSCQGLVSPNPSQTKNTCWEEAMRCEMKVMIRYL